jgi:hypothetical protein
MYDGVRPVPIAEPLCTAWSFACVLCSIIALVPHFSTPSFSLTHTQVAAIVGVAPMRVYEVATFYTMFNREKRGEWCQSSHGWMGGGDRKTGNNKGPSVVRVIGKRTKSLTHECCLVAAAAVNLLLGGGGVDIVLSLSHSSNRIESNRIESNLLYSNPSSLPNLH